MIRVLHASADLVVAEVPSRSSSATHLTTVAGRRSSCTCPAGRRALRCYHIEAVRMLADELARRAAA